MYIENLNELIKLYDKNNIPYDIPMGINVEFEIDTKDKSIRLATDGNKERYGLKLGYNSYSKTSSDPSDGMWHRFNCRNSLY